MAIRNDGIPADYYANQQLEDRYLPVNSTNNGIPAPQPLYQGLSATSTPAQIAAAYSQFTSGSGGDTAANQDIARSYLTNLGISAPAIEQAYNQFTQPASVAQTVANTSGIGSLGIGTNVDYSGTNFNLARTPTSDVLTNATAGVPTNTANNNVLGGLILAGDSFLSGSSNVPTIASQTGQNVTSVAVGGSTTSDVINQLNQFQSSGGTFAPGSTVMLNLGGNDLLQGADPATVRNNLNQIVSRLNNVGVKVILSGASDVGSIADVTGSTNLAMSSIYNDVAANNPNVTLVDAMSGLLNQKNLVDETGFHLNTAGQTAFNAALSNAYLNSIGKGNINYTDQGIKDFAEAAGLSLEQALALAPYFKVSEDRVRSALGGETELYKKFGITDNAAAPTTENILSGFKYANESGLTEDSLKKTLGEDVFNTYKKGFADFAKTGIANILADDKLSFDEARTAVKFGRDYGYDTQKLADLTGTKKEVFDAIYKNYDDRTNQIVDSVLGAEDVKTNDDKIARAFALEKKFGFTNEDFAKATDLSVDQVKGLLDPLRNFEGDYRKIRLNTDSTTADIKKFVEDARTNGAISQFYSKGLEEVEKEIAGVEDRWKNYNGVDPFQAQRVYDQITQQREKANPNYFRGTFADPMKTAATLSRLGIDTLADIGQKGEFEAVPAEKRHFAPDGTPLQDFGNGTFGVADGEGGYSSVVPKNQVKTVYGRTESTLNPDGETSTSTFVEIPESEIDKDGNYQQKIGNVAIDKDTGKEIAGIDGTIDAEKSGRWNNRKLNELKVGFAPNGMPVVYSTQEKTGFGALVQDLAPMISMALPFVLPGVGATLSSGLANIGGSALATGSLANAALTQGILSGGMTALGGGQFEKGFLGGAVSPFVSSGISNLLPTGMNPDLAKSITGAGTGAVRGAIQGNADFGDLLKTGILEGVSNYGLNTALGSSGLTPQQLNFATGIAVPLLQGEKVSPARVFGTLANYQASQQNQGKRP